MDDFWTQRLRRTLASYDDALLRQVAEKLCRPRNQWPAEELIGRSLATLENAANLDRRLKDQTPGGRMILALIGHSRLLRWPVGNLIEAMHTLGHIDAFETILELLQGGLLYPELFPPFASEVEAPLPPRQRVKDFATWLAQSRLPEVFTHAAVTARALGGKQPLPESLTPVLIERPVGVREADGLEWPLRLAALWQQVVAAPLRRTQQRDFFKRDVDRLQTDPLLSQPPADALATIPDPALFTVALGLAVGVLEEKDGELRPGRFPESWNEGLPATLASLWAALPTLESWNPLEGWKVHEPANNPHVSAQLVSLLLLGRLNEGAFLAPAEIDRWIGERHPFWAGARADDNGNARATTKKGAKSSEPEPGKGIADFLLGVAYPMRLLQAVRNDDGEWLVRLSGLGRWLLGFADLPPSGPQFPQTVLVQPNLEILAYRQGLNPELIIRLGNFATWKGLGAACTLQLEPHSVYRALESGETFAGIVQTLERHGMKALPTAVLDSLRTWSNKRERITVYPAAVLLEFPGAAEMNEAFTRGLPAVRLTERLAVVPAEKAMDYRHFRLTGTRDYCLPVEKCVDVEADGVTLNIDLGRSDLLLETEVLGFAEPSPRPAPPGRRYYSLTPRSIASAHNQGLSVANLETWFAQRTGLPISPAALLLMTAAENPPLELRRQLVLHVTSAEIADGLQQWPGTRALIQGRLGPTTLTVADKDVPALQTRCAELGLKLFHGEG